MKRSCDSAEQSPLTETTLEVGVRSLVSEHTELALLVERYGSPPLWERPQTFATLALIILEQQVALASAAAVFRRLEDALEGEVTSEAISALGRAGLQLLGVTRQTSRYLVALADEMVQRRLALEELNRLSDDEVAARLMQVTGIGPWTANIYLLMALRRPDVWPVGDLALNKILTEIQGLRVTSADALAMAEKWRPWRAVAARILWNAYLARRTDRSII